MMIHLKVVKTQTQQEEDRAEAAEAIKPNLNNGMEVLMELVSPWYGYHRLVFADSYFSSLQTALKRKERGLKYIGVVKTATHIYPIALLGRHQLQDRGEHYGLVVVDD
jgi:Transposase IS4